MVVLMVPRLDSVPVRRFPTTFVRNLSRQHVCGRFPQDRPGGTLSQTTVDGHIGRKSTTAIGVTINVTIVSGKPTMVKSLNRYPPRPYTMRFVW